MNKFKTIMMIAVVGMLFMLPQISNANPTTASCTDCHEIDGGGGELHDTHNDSEVMDIGCLDCHDSIGDTPASSTCADCHGIAPEIAYGHAAAVGCLDCHVEDSSITGSVTGDETDGVTITLSGDADEATPTSGNGNYIFTDLGAGTYTVTPSLDGCSFTPAATEVTLTDDNGTIEGVYLDAFVSECEDDVIPEDNATTVLDLEEYGLAIWDFSGNYEQSLTDNMTNLTYTLIQDPKGKLTGEGEYLGSDNMTIPVEVKGKVKLKKDLVVVDYKVKGKNDAGDKFDNKYKLELMGADNETTANTLDGTQKGKVCVKGEKCSKIDEIPASVPVADDMDGDALVQVAIADENGYKDGQAQLLLSNDDTYDLDAKGKFNSKKGERKYQLKGVDNATGIKLTVTVESDNNTATKISGKALGQKLKYKQAK